MPKKTNLRRFSLFVLLAAACTLFVSAAWAADGNTTTAVYLSWQRSPESTMTIRWITPLQQANDTIAFRKIGEEQWFSTTGAHIQLPQNEPFLLHSVELTNLAPATAYQFVINSEGKPYKFRTMPADLYTPVRFVAGGDMYHDGIEYLHETNLQAAKTSPHFALVGGDIAYASNKKAGFLPRWTHPYMDHIFGQKFDRWHQWLVTWTEDMVTPDGYLIPMVVAIGNHDVNGRFDQTPEQAPFFYTLFCFPGPTGYNVLDFGNYMSLIILDSGHSNPIGGQQASWLSETLCARKTVPHKFALYHVPAYPSVHGLSNEYGAAIRKHWVPSFEAYRLTAAFENHEHAYKRTHPLRGGEVSPHGVVYIGDGGWGVKKPRRPRHVDKKPYLAKTASARHFLLVDVHQEHQTVRAIDSDGNTVDSFSW